jgi:4-diphosphocytidyl-2-C-methyl-D-erythritol kinase
MRRKGISMIDVFAPAKINLSLHVTGQRSDGYHELDSLVVFVDVGDVISAKKAAQTEMSACGPFGKNIPTDDRNLVVQAAALSDFPMVIELEKNLPASSGIGGGSADAAAALRAALQLGAAPVSAEQSLSLGADVPVCLSSTPARMQGVGDALSSIQLPQLHMVLVNPGVAVATPDVFRGLKTKENEAMPAKFPQWPDGLAFADWLGAQRNDLQTPAAKSVPEIAAVLVALALLPEVLLTRMSGSGATCFALFESRDAADNAAKLVSQNNPWWWVKSASTLLA